MENLNGLKDANIYWSKSFYESQNKPVTDWYSINPISYAIVSTSNELSSIISHGEIDLMNTVYYFDENDELVDRCTENVGYNVYIGDDSWISC